MMMRLLLVALFSTSHAQSKCLLDELTCNETIFAGYERGMYISGYATDDFDPGTDVFDFNNNLNLRDDCAIPPFPRPNSGMVSAVHDGKVVACGGHQVDTCYTYDPSVNEWSDGPALAENRFSAASFVTGDGRFVISGGNNEGDGNIQTDTAYVLDPGASEFYVDEDLALPMPLFAHCMVSLNGTHVFLAGGRDQDGDTKRAFILNIEADDRSECILIS